jgi:hypothetical protein
VHPDELKDRMVAAEPRPTTDEQLDDAFALAEEVADGCADKYGDALGASTPSTPPGTWTGCARRSATSS